MIKCPLSQKGEIQYLEVFKIASLLAILFVLLANLFQKSQTITNAAPALLMAIHLLMIIQAFIVAYEVILDFIEATKHFVIKNLYGYQIKNNNHYNGCPIKKETYIQQFNQLYLNMQVIRC